MSDLSVTNESSCPVCGKSYVQEYDICSVCGWENHPNQRWKPDLPGGANEMSLREARYAFHSGNPIK